MSDAQCDGNLAVVVVWGMGAIPRREADGENLMLNCCQCSRASVAFKSGWSAAIDWPNWQGGANGRYLSPVLVARALARLGQTGLLLS